MLASGNLEEKKRDRIIAEITPYVVVGNKVTVSARLIQINGLGYTATEKV